jgi:hypothetical protein
MLACSAPDQANGDSVGATALQTPVEVCPQITAFMASPMVMGLGGKIDLTSGAEVSDPARELSYYWIANSGVFADATLARTHYTCLEAGVHQLLLVVSDGECADSRRMPVSCVNSWVADEWTPDP